MVAVSVLSEEAESKEVGRAMVVTCPEDFVELVREEDYGAGKYFYGIKKQNFVDAVTNVKLFAICLQIFKKIFEAHSLFAICLQIFKKIFEAHSLIGKTFCIDQWT